LTVSTELDVRNWEGVLLDGATEGMQEGILLGIEVSVLDGMDEGTPLDGLTVVSPAGFEDGPANGSELLEGPQQV
jgi:hypothetical protein